MNRFSQTGRRPPPPFSRRPEAAWRANAPARHAAQPLPRIYAALDRFARWSPLIALAALALVARAVVKGLVA